MKSTTNNLIDIKNDFSSADAVLTSVMYNGQTLEIQVTDWRGTPWKITFSDVVSFRWNSEDFSKYIFEHVSIVENSSWIKELKENHNNLLDVTEAKFADVHQTKIAETKLIHYLITINAVGTLEVAGGDILFDKK